MVPSELLPGLYYDLTAVEPLVRPPFHPVKARYERSYEACGKTVLAFTVRVRKEAYFAWLSCWCHVASNHRVINEPDGSTVFETHIFADRLTGCAPSPTGLQGQERGRGPPSKTPL